MNDTASNTSCFKEHKRETDLLFLAISCLLYWNRQNQDTTQQVQGNKPFQREHLLYTKSKLNLKYIWVSSHCSFWVNPALYEFISFGRIAKYVFTNPRFYGNPLVPHSDIKNQLIITMFSGIQIFIGYTSMGLRKGNIFANSVKWLLHDKTWTAWQLGAQQN